MRGGGAWFLLSISLLLAGNGGVGRGFCYMHGAMARINNDVFLRGEYTTMGCVEPVADGGRRAKMVEADAV